MSWTLWVGVLGGPSVASAQSETTNLPAGPAEETIPLDAENDLNGSVSLGKRSEALETEQLAPLYLILVGVDDARARAVLLRRLREELGVPVVVAEASSSPPSTRRVVVTRDASAGELAVSYVDADGHTTTRVVDDPADPEDRARLVSFLAEAFIESAPVAPVAAAQVASSNTPEQSSSSEQPSPAAPPVPVHPAHVALFHPLSSNVNEPNVETYFSLSLLYGRVGRLRGLGFGGFQIAQEELEGLQMSFLGNIVHGSASGAQAAFGFNSAHRLEGLQVALLNHARDSALGLQLGGVSYVGGELEGGQASLALNVAGDVTGAQLGLVNVAGKVRGAQLGLINVADDVEGVPLGLVSVTKSGGVHPMVWYSNNSYVNAGIQFATRYTYTFVHASFETDDSKTGPGFGFGGIIPTFSPRLFVDVDLGQTVLFDNGGDLNDIRYLTKIRGSLRFQFLKHLGVFVGGGVAGRVERDWQRLETDPSLDSASLPYAYDTLGEFFAGVRL